MASNTRPVSPERKEYKRQWMAAFRAKQREPKNGGNGEQSNHANAERIAALEQELASLKADVGLDITIEPTPQELRQKRIAALERDLADLFKYHSIKALTSKVADAQKEFEAIRQGGEWFNQEHDRRAIEEHRKRIREMHEAVEYHERMVAELSPGGRIRAEKEAAIADDENKLQRMLNSNDYFERELGYRLRNRSDKSRGDLELALAQHKAKLKQLRE